MSLARLPTWALGAAAAAALALAALGPSGWRWPLVAVAGGSGLLVTGRRRSGPEGPPRIEVLARVALTARSHGVLLSVDGAGWLVVVGDGVAHLARAELAAPARPELVREDAP